MSVYRKPGARGPSYYYEFEWQHQRYRKEGFPSKRLAEHAEKSRRLEVQTQGHEALYGSIGPKLLTWPEALAKYAQAKTNVATQPMILARLQWWAHWLESQDAHYIQAVTREMIEAGLTHLAQTPGEGKGRRYKIGRSPQTQKHYRAQLHAFYQKAVKVWGVMSRNPVEQLDTPIHVPKFKPRILEPDARRRLVLAAEPHMRQVILFGLYTGMREMAIMGLEGEDLHIRPGWLRAWDYKPVRHGFPPEAYYIPLVPTLAKVVRELGVVSGPLWRTADGSRIRQFQRKAWLRTLARAGYMAQVPVDRAPRPAGTPGPTPRAYRLTPTLRFHDLRHMVGVSLAEAGVPADVIRAFMHHASKAASEIYTKWVSDKAVIAAGEKLAAAHNFED
jgi:integrase